MILESPSIPVASEVHRADDEPAFYGSASETCRSPRILVRQWDITGGPQVS
jgi:hypothetical protein